MAVRSTWPRGNLEEGKGMSTVPISLTVNGDRLSEAVRRIERITL